MTIKNRLQYECRFPFIFVLLVLHFKIVQLPPQKGIVAHSTAKLQSCFLRYNFLVRGSIPCLVPISVLYLIKFVIKMS